MLKLSHTPRLAREDVLMTHTDQQQVRHHGNAKGVLDSSFLSTYLVLAQTQVRLQFSVDLLSVPLRRPLYTQVMRRLLR